MLQFCFTEPINSSLAVNTSSYNNYLEANTLVDIFNVFYYKYYSLRSQRNMVQWKEFILSVGQSRLSEFDFDYPALDDKITTFTDGLTGY